MSFSVTDAGLGRKHCGLGGCIWRVGCGLEACGSGQDFSNSCGWVGGQKFQPAQVSAQDSSDTWMILWHGKLFQKTVLPVFFKENVRNPVWICSDPISLILGTRFSLIFGADDNFL